MNLKVASAYLKFTNQQRTGIFLLFIIIIILQGLYFFVDFSFVEKEFPEKQQWMALQSEIDSLKSSRFNEKPKVYSFNPNFISDYKGYKLGMSTQEIDRLLAFRKENKYVSSAEEFQEVTKISDSLLLAMSPLFKFPDWVQNKTTYKIEKKEFQKRDYEKKEK